MKRNTGTYWSAGELRKLEALWKRYKNMEAVAEILERTPGGLR